MTPILNVIGQAEGLSNVSRKETSTELRKLIGFSIHSTVDSVLKNIAFGVSNSSTNSASRFISVKLFEDRDGGALFDPADTELSSISTVEGGAAVFSGLSIPVTSTAKTYFLAASFDPSKQDRNSFISASLHSQNISAFTSTTDEALVTSGGSILRL